MTSPTGHHKMGEMRTVPCVPVRDFAAPPVRLLATALLPRPAAVLAALLLSAGCTGGDSPAPVQPEMVSLYSDLALAAGVTGEAAPDSVRRAIYGRHGITPEEFEEALRTYRRDPRAWVRFFSAVVDTLEARVLR